MDPQRVIGITRNWIETAVIGLNLCPFARRVYRAESIRYVASEAKGEADLLDDLGKELKYLASTPIAETETTLIIHPNALRNFLDYNDFLSLADEMIARLQLRGIIQIASFHPDYQFAGTQPTDVENYTNRSPFPMLHLLREESISQVAGEGDELLEIPKRNIQLLRSLGRTKLVEMMNGIVGDRPA